MASVNVYLLHLMSLPNSSPCHLVGLDYSVNKQLVGMSSVIVVTGEKMFD
jgi:hypothetical protein